MNVAEIYSPSNYLFKSSQIYTVISHARDSDYQQLKGRPTTLAAQRATSVTKTSHLDNAELYYLNERCLARSPRLLSLEDGHIVKQKVIGFFFFFFKWNSQEMHEIT